MPIPPPPHRYHCPACNWSKTVAPSSDVLLPGFDHFSVCPKCNHAPLDTQAVTGLAGGIAQLTGALESLFKR